MGDQAGTPVPSVLLTHPEVPGASSLLGEDARSLLAAAVAPLELIDYRTHQVVCHLGRSLTVAYTAELRSRETEITHKTFVAQVGEPAASGALVMSAGAEEVSVWVYPDDPHLPGLASLFDRSRVGELLQQVGVDDTPTQMDTRSYRPGRRAVVEVRTERHRLFIKAVPPTKALELHRLHRLMAPAVPVPASLGVAEEAGLVVLEARPGRPLAEALATDRFPISPEEILAVLDRLPAADRPAVSPMERAADHARLLSLLLPGHADLLASTVASIFPTTPEPSVPVHGDFHAGQLLVESGSSPTLIDIDRAGMGSRSDDLAGLLAHLAVLEAPRAFRRALLASFNEGVDPAGLRRRTAAALLGFATGPFVTQRPDWPSRTAHLIELAAHWAEAAKRSVA